MPCPLVHHDMLGRVSLSGHARLVSASSYLNLKLELITIIKSEHMNSFV